MEGPLPSSTTGLSSLNPMSTDSHSDALRDAQQELRRCEVAWHRKRAEVARLMATGNEAAADRLLAEIGESPEKGFLPDKIVSDSADSASLRPSTTPAVATLPQATPSPTAVPSATLSLESKSLPSEKSRSPKPQSKFSRPSFLVSWGKWLGEKPSWLWSTVIHSTLLIVLATMSFVSFVDPPFFLSAAIHEGDLQSERISEMPLTQFDPIELETDLLSEESLEETIAEPIELVSFTEAAPTVSDALLSGALLGHSAEMAASPPGGGNTKDGKGAGKGKTKTGKVRFFGSESVGDRVVFIVDNSGSMQRGRMETTLMELDRAVQSLSYSQSFYVIFYSDQVYPMFFPASVEELLPATRKNKRKLSAWLPSIEICLGGRLLDAMELAATLDPQVVYLLSDGDIRSERVMDALTETEAWPFTIHTLGMGARSEKHAMNLAAIAQANGGGFRLVTAHPQAVLRSQRRPIRYHREQGEVWGSRVQAWR